MPEPEVLVRELLAVNGLAAGAVAAGEVTRLAHEVRDDAVEDAALVVQRLAGSPRAPLPGAQRPEVLAGSRRHVDAELERDAADGGTADAHVEEATREGRHERWCPVSRPEFCNDEVPLRESSRQNIAPISPYLSPAQARRASSAATTSRDDRRHAHDDLNSRDDDGRSPREAHGGYRASKRGEEGGHHGVASWQIALGPDSSEGGDGGQGAGRR